MQLLLHILWHLVPLDGARQCAQLQLVARAELVDIVEDQITDGSTGIHSALGRCHCGPETYATKGYNLFVYM